MDFPMPMLTVSKAAKVFQVSRPTLQRALKNGTISGEKSVEGGVEVWQIDTAELARVYKIRRSEADSLPRQKIEIGSGRDTSKIGDHSDLSGDVVKQLQAKLQAVQDELTAALAVSEERKRMIDEYVRSLPKPAAEEQARRGFWARLMKR
ncbi:hypothetical protein [Paracoccus sp. S4493]|uniref:hypothetical protein n=1 Tax=Paracoccus sp. S4493 TaxID=579490 RepID=UPI0012ECF68C|nr:hypothetical protein [Paracoccus sp. S4493]